MHWITWFLNENVSVNFSRQCLLVRVRTFSLCDQNELLSLQVLKLCFATGLEQGSFILLALHMKIKGEKSGGIHTIVTTLQLLSDRVVPAHIFHTYNF